MLDPELIGRSPVERTELRYRTDVSVLGAWRQIAHRHVVDHALAQRRDRLDHRKLLSNWDCTKAQSLQTAGCLPMDPTPIEIPTDQPGNYSNVIQAFSQKHLNLGTDHRHSDYRGSGLVQRALWNVG
jgi:hypothetical protein